MRVSRALLLLTPRKPLTIWKRQRSWIKRLCLGLNHWKTSLVISIIRLPPFLHIFMHLWRDLIMSLFIIQEKMSNMSLWESLRESPSNSTLMLRSSSSWQRVEWIIMLISLALNIHLLNMIKSMSQNSIQEPWRTWDSSLTMKLTFQDQWLALSSKKRTLPSLYCMSLPTCGLETWSQWNGGTISGLTKVSLLLWATWLQLTAKT